MAITKIWRLYLLTLAILVMVGCGSTPTDEGEQVEITPKVEVPEGTEYDVRNGKLVVDGDTLDGLFYFDFDQSIVKRRGHSELNTHAQALSDNSDFRVRLEGHADERGTREYNNALGERRAIAIRAYLMNSGALSSQIEVISYGEEKPAVDESNESAWAENRRVEIVYR